MLSKNKEVNSTEETNFYQNYVMMKSVFTVNFMCVNDFAPTKSIQWPLQRREIKKTAQIYWPQWLWNKNNLSHTAKPRTTQIAMSSVQLDAGCILLCIIHFEHEIEAASTQQE